MNHQIDTQIANARLMRLPTHKEAVGAAEAGVIYSRIREIPAAEVKAMIERGERVVYLDVREPNEYNLGHLPGAVHVPRGRRRKRHDRVAAVTLRNAAATGSRPDPCR